MLFSCDHHFLARYGPGFSVSAHKEFYWRRGSIPIAHVPLSYTVALKEQPTYPFFPAPFDVIIPASLAAFGQLLVITSTWALGITGTFLGDYFGILMDHVSFTFELGGCHAEPLPTTYRKSSRSHSTGSVTLCTWVQL